MLPIPQDIDLDSLRETKVTEISYTPAGITLFFEDAGHITINGYFALRHGKQRHEYYKIAPVSCDYGLLNLLNVEVTEVYLSNNRDSMTIEFVNGSRLELMGHKIEDMYIIHIKDREATV